MTMAVLGGELTVPTVDGEVIMKVMMLVAMLSDL